MKPVNVLFKRAQDNASWAGYCAELEFTEADEIAIDVRWVEEHTYRPNKRTILSIYLHECAHRLLPNAEHNAVFFALNMLMYLRADLPDSHSTDIWQQMSLYDLQDEPDISAAL